MIVRRLILALAAAAAVAASAATCVVALAFTLYALVEPLVGRAGAAAILTGATALMVALGAMVLMAMARPPRRARPRAATAAGLADRAVDFVREKPVVAIAGALAVGFLAVRNPGYLGSAVRAFIEGREAPGR